MSIVSQEHLAIIQATAGAVAPKVDEITAVFYRDILAAHPGLWAFFNKGNMESGRQQRHLAEAIIAYVTHIEALGNLKSAVARIAAKHCSLGVQAAHYQVVHDVLMGAIGQVLGAIVTPEIAAAWSAAVMALAGVFVKTEADLYARTEASSWAGKRPFTVTKVVQETDTVKSLTLTPVDGKAVGTFIPGQYVTVNENPSQDEVFAPRHYTITSPPSASGNASIRLSVKAQGIMSNWICDRKEGDVIQVGPPYGPECEHLDAEHKARPLVIISQGIGITAVLAVLEAALNTRDQVWFFHCDYDPSKHAFRQEIETEAKDHPNVKLSYHYSHNDTNVQVPHGSNNRMTSAGILAKLAEGKVDLSIADILLSLHAKTGDEVEAGLAAAGVPSSSVKHLMFGYFDHGVDTGLEGE
jgi:nitric oxide dioxygenase